MRLSAGVILILSLAMLAGCQVHNAETQIDSTKGESAAKDLSSTLPRTLHEIGIDVDELDFSQICAAYEETLTTFMSMSEAESFSKEIPNFVSSRNAQEWALENAWIRGITTERFNAVLTGFIAESLPLFLNDYLQSSDHPLAREIENGFQDVYQRMLFELEAQIPFRCDLKMHEEAIYEVAGKADEVLRGLENAPWFPRGFELAAEDQTIAYKFVQDRTCDLGLPCWNMDILTSEGCSTLYVELNILDQSSAVVGYTNDLLKNILPGEVAQLQFANTYSNGETARVSEMTCLP